jgi:hypothetical protein
MHCRLRWPLIVGADVVGVAPWAEVSSGQAFRRPASMAAHQVAKARETMDARQEAMRSATVDRGVTELAEHGGEIMWMKRQR